MSFTDAFERGESRRKIENLVNRLTAKLTKKEKSKILDKPIKPKYFKR